MMIPDMCTVQNSQNTVRAPPPIPLGVDPAALQDCACAIRSIRKFPLAPAYAKLSVRAVNF
jgi:hypothetical protein